MSSTKKGPASREASSGKFVMGRSRMDKLNAIEGLSRSASSRAMFEALDREGASPGQRRTVIAAKHAAKR